MSDEMNTKQEKEDMSFGSSLCEGKREAGEIPARSRRCVVEPPAMGHWFTGRLSEARKPSQNTCPKPG